MASTSCFKFDDKLHDKFDYHAWKLSLDLTLEEQDVMDYVLWKFLNVTHQKSLLHYRVYYLLLVLFIKLFININIEININATFTHIQISN